MNGRVCGTKSTAKECNGDTTETRTNFTISGCMRTARPRFFAPPSPATSNDEISARPWRGSEDPTAHNVTALAVASGIGWVEGVTYRMVREGNLEAVKMCLDAGIDVNAADFEGRTALHGAAHKGSSPSSELVDHGANLDTRLRQPRHHQSKPGEIRLPWQPVEYAEGVVRVGVQSSIAHPEAAELLRKYMKEQGLPIPPTVTESVCIVDVCKGEQASK